MKRRTLVLGGVGAVSALAAVVVINTLTFKGPDKIAMDLPPAPAVDVNKAAGHLSEAVRFKTVSHQDPKDDDRSAWDAQREWLARTYPAFHAVATREILPNGALIYTWAGAEPRLAPIILMAHQDVVPVDDATLKSWSVDPFAGTIRDGAVWGRGSIDDKGSLISLMEAAEALAARGYHPRRTILIVSGQDEEVGGTGARAAAAALKARGVHAVFALDEGMAVIADYPAVGKPVAVIGVAEKGYATLRVTARSAGGHSSAPPKDTAAVTLARAVVAINDHGFPLRYGGLTRDMMRAVGPMMPFVQRMAVANDWLFAPLLTKVISATDQGRATLHTTTAPTMLSASPKANVLPAEAVAHINYRLAPGDTPQAILDNARAAVGDLPVTLALDEGAREPSGVSSTRSESWRTLAALAADQSGAPVVPGLVTAGTDSRSMSDVADDVYRFQPIVFHLKDIEMIHGTNEHLTLANLKAMISYYQRLMLKMGG